LSASGYYSATSGTFTTAGYDRSPLHALSNSAGNGNGVYLYSSSAQMPTESYNAANYWVDVVYTLTGTGAAVPGGLASMSSDDSPAVDTPPASDGSFAPPATKGAALQMIALGLVKPHNPEHEVSFWCPLGTTDPRVAASTWTTAPPVTEEPPAAEPPSRVVPLGALALATLLLLARRRRPGLDQLAHLLDVLLVVVKTPTHYVRGARRIRLATT
jgi:hypothetical protein